MEFIPGVNWTQRLEIHSYGNLEARDKCLATNIVAVWGGWWVGGGGWVGAGRVLGVFWGLGVVVWVFGWGGCLVVWLGVVVFCCCGCVWVVVVFGGCVWILCSFDVVWVCCVSLGVFVLVSCV